MLRLNEIKLSQMHAFRLPCQLGQGHRGKDVDFKFMIQQFLMLPISLLYIVYQNETSKFCYSYISYNLIDFNYFNNKCSTQLYFCFKYMYGALLIARILKSKTVYRCEFYITNIVEGD